MAGMKGSMREDTPRREYVKSGGGLRSTMIVCTFLVSEVLSSGREECYFENLCPFVAGKVRRRKVPERRRTAVYLVRLSWK